MNPIYTTIQPKTKYFILGKGVPILFLHGWGSSSEIFLPLAKGLSQNFKVFLIDLPGFGESEEPDTIWGSFDYAEHVSLILKKEGLSQPIIIAHSMGGRIAFNLLNKVSFRKLILMGSAGIKPKRKPSYYLRVYSYKLMKRTLSLLPDSLRKKAMKSVLNNVGSSDYKNASSRMKQILSRVVNEDYRDKLQLIKCPTLLLWGENDTSTPISNAVLMEKLIPDAGLVRFPNCGHFVFLDKAREVSIIINEFLKEDKYESN